VVFHEGFLPGAVGLITAWHGLYYGRIWGLSERFEAEVARELAELVETTRPGRDLMLLALVEGRMVGSVVIDGRSGDGEGRLRWFVLDQNFAGQGIGRRLLDRALAFCRETGVKTLSLWTFAGLDQARRLYDHAGFRLVEEHPYDGWGRRVTRQRLDLQL
jgi:GNAT superfamily N-acetyltransferase